MSKTYSTAFERVRNALGPDVAYERGNSLRARCPHHGGRARTSLSVKQTDTGAVLHCFAGCEFEDVLDELGLDPADLFDGDRPDGYVPPKRRERTPWQKAIPNVEHLLERIAQREHIEHGTPYTRPHDTLGVEERTIRRDENRTNVRSEPEPEPWEAAHIDAAHRAAVAWAVEHALAHPDVLDGETIAQHLVRVGVATR